MDGVYVAIDFDGLDEAEVAAWMPEPGGSRSPRRRCCCGDRANATVVGAGLTGLLPDPRNLEPAVRLCAALGL